jgi:DNA-directed RNA polymerase
MHEQHPLWQEQLDLEYEMVSRGRAKFQKRLDKVRAAERESEAAYGVRLMQQAHGKVAAAIEAARIEALTGRAGRRAAYVQYLNLLDADVTAYIALRAMLDGMGKKRHLSKLAFDAGLMFKDQVHLDRLLATDEDYYRFTMRWMEESSSKRYRERIVRRFADKGKTGKLLTDMEWSQTDMYHLGVFLIDTANEATGLFERVLVWTGKGQSAIELHPTETAREWVANCTEALQDMSPDFLPTVVPPKPWSGPRDGGYWTKMPRRIRLITGRADREQIKLIKSRDISRVYAALNAIQETPWRINTQVLDVVRQVALQQIAVKKFPSFKEIPMPIQERENLKETDPDAFKRWKRSANRVYEKNKERVASCKTVMDTLEVAERMKGYDAIYFPHNLDFRGRAYAIPKFLNPQGNDVTKSLLTFSDAAPLGEFGRYFLAIHGANCFGYDKVSLAARAQWVEDNADAICLVAVDPLGEGFEFWQKAGDPWCFLAFCLEWESLLWHEATGRADEFLSSLPIAMDGSCNGIQHYSACLLDEVGGRAVNLIPSDTPSDIYGQVADKTTGYLRELLRPEGPTSGFLAALIEKWEKPDEDGVVIDWRTMAQEWLDFGVDRGIAKRSVMTLPYGSTQRSSRDFIEEATREKIEDKGILNPFVTENGDETFEACLWLNPILWHSIGDVVKAARVAMKWLKDCSSLVSKADKPLVWTTADGFPVVQRYMVPKTTVVKTHIAGQMTRLVVLDGDTADLDRRRQSNGVAPNWVHSQDATAMRLATLKAKGMGITSFAMIHDSFGTHAGNAGAFADAIRQSFLDLYTTFDSLKDFHQGVEQAVQEEDRKRVPAIPAKGTLDLSQVVYSAYFFA